MRYDEEDKKGKKPKHRPNQRGVGMRTLNEHDADSYKEFIKPDEDDEDDFLDDEEGLRRLLR